MRYVMLYNILLLVAICFLCWSLHSGWPCLMLFCTAGYKTSCNCGKASEDDADDEDDDMDAKASIAAGR